MASDYLQIPDILANQDSKEVTHNAAVNLLDRAMNQVVTKVITVSTSLTTVETRENSVIELTGTPGTAFTIDMPDTNQRLLLMVNNTDGTTTIRNSAGAGSGQPIIGVGDASFFHYDGTDFTEFAIGGSGGSNAFKDPVRVATTVDGALATAYENGDTVDGVVLATGDRTLLKNQIAGAENGIYTVNATGAPTRALDFDNDFDVTQGSTIVVSEGDVNRHTIWTLTTAGAVVGTTVLSFKSSPVAATQGAGAQRLLRNLVAGRAWTIRTSAADNNWHGVTWSPELDLFAAVAFSGTGDRVMTSPDGINWTIRTSAADNNWISIAWSPELDLFAAVAFSGTGDRVMTSPDGINWTIRTSAADNDWNDIAWSPELGLFAVVSGTGIGNRVMTSPDGINWTIRTSAADNEWRSVTWSPELGLFAAVSDIGIGNRVMTSPDGINWTIRTSAADNEWRSVTWSPELGLFAAVAFSGTGDRVMTSPDGINWTIRTSAADNEWRSVTWSPELDLFAAVSQNGVGDRVMTSPDGINWTIRTSAADNNWISIAWSPELGLFAAVAFSGTGDRVMTSPRIVTD